MNWWRRLFIPFKERVICINGPIYTETASVVVSQLLFLESEKPLEPIHLYINSFGCAVNGRPVKADRAIRKYSVTPVNVHAGLAIYDAMQYIRSPVSTYCLGQSSCMGSLLLAAGTPGERCALPHSRVMIWQGIAFNLYESTLKIRVKEIYGHHTGQPIERIEQCMDRGTSMSPEEAKEFGLVDKAIAHRPSGP